MNSKRGALHNTKNQKDLKYGEMKELAAINAEPQSLNLDDRGLLLFSIWILRNSFMSKKKSYVAI